MSVKLRRFSKEVGLAELLLYAMILVSPLVVYRLDFLGFNLSAQRLLVLSAGGTWVLRHLIHRRLPLPPSRKILVVLGVFALLISYEAAQLLRTVQLGFALSFVAGLVGGFVIVSVIVLILDTAQKLKLGVTAFLASSVIPLALGLYQTLGMRLGYPPVLPFKSYLYSGAPIDAFPILIQGGFFVRASSDVGAPAFHGEYIVFVTMFLLALLIYRRSSATQLAAVGLLLTLTGFSLLSTIARSAWLLMAVGLVFIAFHARKDLWSFVTGRLSRWVLPGVATGMIVLVLITAFPLVGVFQDSVGSVVWEPKRQLTAEEIEAGVNEPVDASPNVLRQSTSEHQQLRLGAVDIFLKNPVFGVGLGNLGVATEQLPGTSSAQATGFNFLAEGGLVGILVLALFMGAFLLPIRSAFLRHRGNPILGPYLMGLYGCVFLLVLNNTVIYDTLFSDYAWVILGLSLAAVRASNGGAPGSETPLWREGMSHSSHSPKTMSKTPESHVHNSIQKPA